MKIIAVLSFGIFASYYCKGLIHKDQNLDFDECVKKMLFESYKA